MADGLAFHETFRKLILQQGYGTGGRYGAIRKLVLLAISEHSAQPNIVGPSFFLDCFSAPNFDKSLEGAMVLSEIHAPHQ